MKNIIKNNDDISIDDFEPRKKKPVITQSQWRKEMIGDNFNQEIGLDELKKIKRHLKQKVPDFEIMHTYGINAETIVAIKNNRFCAVEGILKDDLDFLYLTLKELEKNIFELKSNIIKTIKNSCYAQDKDVAKIKKLFNEINKYKEEDSVSFVISSLPIENIKDNE